jgi:hypothetical protein
MHLGPFGCRTKLSAKRAELVQKFVPRSRVLIFRNKHIRLAPLGPKLMFLSISYYLGAFSTVWLPYKTRCKTGRSGAKVRAMKSCQAPNPPHWAQNSCFIAFHTIWVHLGPFGCVTILSAKRTKLMQKFVPRSRVGIFHNERDRSTPLDSKLMCLVRIILFGCIWGRLVALQNSVQNGSKWCKSSCQEVGSEFFATNAPDPPHWTLTSCIVVFRTIWAHLGKIVALPHLA